MRQSEFSRLAGAWNGKKSRKSVACLPSSAPRAAQQLQQCAVYTWEQAHTDTGEESAAALCFRTASHCQIDSCLIRTKARHCQAEDTLTEPLRPISTYAWGARGMIDVASAART
eukprot:1160212-Pelagomonas_calceolata.AAC.6